MERGKIKVSVIIPVYNAEPFLREALDSVTAQTQQEMELLLVENGSQDQSLPIMQEYQKRFPWIRILKGDGISSGTARNIGLEVAAGEYILFVDADDYLPDPQTIHRYVRAAEQTGADLVAANYARLWDGRILPAKKHSTFSGYRPQSEEFCFRGFFSTGTLSYVWGKLYRTAFLRENGLQFSDLPYAEDKLFNMQCCLCGAQYVFVEEIGYIYRKNDASISWQYRPDSVESWIRLMQLLEEWCQEKEKSSECSAWMMWCTLFFAAFFDAKMEYRQNSKKSLRAIRNILGRYGKDPIGKAAFAALAKRKTTTKLEQKGWKLMIRSFSLGMRAQCYLLLAIGIRLLLHFQIDERLSDTGIRKEEQE